jgi:hypothetical protein
MYIRIFTLKKRAHTNSCTCTRRFVYENVFPDCIRVAGWKYSVLEVHCGVFVFAGKRRKQRRERSCEGVIDLCLFAFLYSRPFWNWKLKSMTLSVYNFYISQTSTSNRSTSYSIGIQSITKPSLIYPTWPRSHSSGTTFRGARRGSKESWSQAYIAAEGGRQTNKIGHANADARQSEYISESISVTPALEQEVVAEMRRILYLSLSRSLPRARSLTKTRIICMHTYVDIHTT